MKILFVLLLAVVGGVFAKTVNLNDVVIPKGNAHGYHTDVGIPLAKQIREAEEKGERIIGGLPAVIGQFPYQAGIIINLMSGNQSVCGGAILTASRVLTAAHCWWNRRDQALSFVVVGGSANLFSGGTRYVTSHVIMHGQWNPDTLQSNIAMVYVPFAFPLSSSLAVIPLPTDSEIQENFAGLIGTVSGYGVRADDGIIATSQFLSYANVFVITNTECQKSFNVEDNIICSLGGGNGGGICYGDGGSPLALIRNSRRILIGISSLISTRGCEAGYASGYTRITSYIDWIRRLI